MSHVEIAHWVDQIGVFVGTVGICVFIYLHWATLDDFGWSMKTVFLLLGTALWLLSSEALVNKEIAVVTFRVIGHILLIVVQIILIYRYYKHRGIPTPYELSTKFYSGIFTNSTEDKE